MEKKNEYRTQFNLELIISLVLVMVTTLGSTIPLYIYTSRQTHDQISAIHKEISAIHKEMTDFHGRLCAIEEKIKK